VLPLIRDANGDCARNYDVSGTSVFVIRPDGYLGIVARGGVASGRCGGFAAALRNTGAPPRGRRRHW